MKKTVIYTSDAPEALGPYSQAIRSGNSVYISGQLAIDPATSKLIEGTIEDKTKQILTNMTAILKEAGGTLENIVKTTIFLTDLADFSRVNTTYGQYFTSSPPARATIQVAALPLGAEIEIEAVAILDEADTV